MRTAVAARVEVIYERSLSVDAHVVSMARSSEDLVESVVLRRYLATIIGERSAYLKTRAERTARG